MTHQKNAFADLYESVYASNLVPRSYEGRPYSDNINFSAIATGLTLWNFNRNQFPRSGVVGNIWTGENASGLDFFLALHGVVIGTAFNPTSVTVSYGNHEASALMVQHGFTQMNSNQIYTAAGGSTAAGNELYLGRSADYYSGLYLWFVPFGSTVTITGGPQTSVYQFPGLYIYGKFANNLQAIDRYLCVPWKGNYILGTLAAPALNSARYGAVYAVPYATAEKNGLVSNFPGNNNVYPTPVLYSAVVPLSDIRGGRAGTFGIVQTVGHEFISPANQNFASTISLTSS